MFERILAAIHSTRPAIDFRARAVIEAIVLSRGSIGSAHAVAQVLGLTNRFQLARLLEREGLPPLHRMTEWVTVLTWLDAAEHARVSLCWIAFRAHRHPSACYRLVKQVTGHGWERLVTKGSAWALQQFLNEVRRHRGQHPFAPAERSPRITPEHRSRAHARSRIQRS